MGEQEVGGGEKALGWYVVVSFYSHVNDLVAAPGERK